MDMLVHASLREGLARALPQALIAGKPVVSYDIDGAREVAITGETGFLVPPRWRRWSSRFVKLASDPDCATGSGHAGRERFTEQFRHETMTRRIRELYERCWPARRDGRRSQPAGKTASFRFQNSSRYDI